MLFELGAFGIKNNTISLVVDLVILVFFGVGYLFGRLFL